jgi:hypothetical protein
VGAAKSPAATTSMSAKVKKYSRKRASVIDPSLSK